MAAGTGGRSIELMDGGESLVVRFPYHPGLVQVVRGLSRRRFDGLSKHWVAPAEIVVEVVETLLPHGFTLTATVRELYAARGGAQPLGAGGASSASAAGSQGGASPADPGASDGAAPAASPLLAAAAASGVALLSDAPRAPASRGGAEAGGAPESWSVSAINARVHRALRVAFPERVWVVGEIAGFDRNRHRGHVWFELLEKAGESEGGAIRATVTAVLFERTRRELEKKLAAADAPFELKDGLEVRLCVTVDLYEPKGAYQLVVEDVDPVHTLGKIAQNRAAVLAELDRLGLREANRSLPWPLLPLRIGVITSVGSDAWNDFVNELGRSGYAFATTAIDARMQGAGLERGLSAALSWFAARAGDFDVVAIVRGGGAKGDLLWFDNKAVALAVARLPIKLVSGIGHTRDVSVIDLIAHSEKTPTAAAAAIVAQVEALDERLAGDAAELAARLQQRMAEARGELRSAAERLVAGARAAGQGERERLAAARDRLAPATRARLRSATRAAADASVRLGELARARARIAAGALEALRRRFAPDVLRTAFARRGQRLDALARLAASLSPAATLRRGFAIVRDAAGRTLRDAGQSAPGSEIRAQLAKGSITARVVRSDDDGA